MAFKKKIWSLSLTNSTFNLYFLSFSLLDVKAVSSVYSWVTWRLFTKLKCEKSCQLCCSYSTSPLYVFKETCESVLERTSFYPLWFWTGCILSLRSRPEWTMLAICNLIWRIMYCGAPDLSMFPFYETWFHKEWKELYWWKSV